MFAVDAKPDIIIGDEYSIDFSAFWDKILEVDMLLGELAFNVAENLRLDISIRPLLLQDTFKSGC